MCFFRSHQANTEQAITQKKQRKTVTRKNADPKHNVDQAIVDLLEDRRKRQQKADIQDEDILYFHSCALRYKQFTQSQKGLFQIKMAQLFFDIENGPSCITVQPVRTTVQPNTLTTTAAYTTMQPVVQQTPDARGKSLATKRRPPKCI